MSLECEGQGAVCSFEGCGVFDFLPTICHRCVGVFCSSHSDPETHICPNTPETSRASQPDIKKSRREFLVCSTCKQQNIFVTMCSICHNAMCVAHRFEHQHESSTTTLSTRVDHVAIAAGSSAEVKVRLGPLPAGARGQECLVVVARASEVMMTSPTTSSLQWCRGVIGLGGSAGRICDDVIKSAIVSTVQTNAAPNSAVCTAFKISVQYPLGDTVLVARDLDDGVKLTALMSLQRIEGHELAQDFMSHTEEPTAAGLFALLFVVGAVPLGDNEDNTTTNTLRANISMGLMADKELLRRFRWFAANALRRAAARNDAPVAKSLDTNDRMRSVADPSSETHHLATDSYNTSSSSSVCPPLVSRVLQNPFAMKFASTKSTPRGASAVKSAVKRYVAVVFGHQGALKSGSDAFVMVVDPSWPVGKLLDRILDEAADLGCPRDANLFAGPLDGGASRGGSNHDDSPLAWGLVHLPSRRWILSPSRGGGALSSACGVILDDKSAVLVVAAPVASLINDAPVVPCEALLITEDTQQLPPADAAKKLKLLQMKECCVM
ncbi:zinc finger protein, putative [Bodo saltans]|uniref:Zinc finger protein, putative n=1 Tax=Bodo saltans TaxID=75058 RepID=A0A0S4JF93_BODSA|nr:zinc finger protein, putative [Bodo saltans]|eukprot:CUG88718.1 zinc finger protein, putative [Bodo saltans]